MVYIEFNLESGAVVKIHQTEPTTVMEGYGIHPYEGTDFVPGDEFTYLITLARDKNGVVTGMGWVQQSQTAQFILRQLADKDAKISQLQAIIDTMLTGGAV